MNERANITQSATGPGLPKALRALFHRCLASGGNRPMRQGAPLFQVTCTGTGPLFQRPHKAGNPRGALSARPIRTIVDRGGAAAGIDGRVSGHSLRIGSAQSLVRAAASMPELEQAGPWQSDRTPARYTRAERAGSGAVARFRYGND